MQNLSVSASERWRSVDEIARHLGVASITIYRWVESGKIPGHKVGKQWRFLVQDVDAWVKSGNPKQSIKPKNLETDKHQ